MTAIKYRTADVDSFKIFYREAGPADAPAILLLHGFPTSSHMFRDLIPLLADRFRLVAPDLPGFGRSDMPPRDGFAYTFDHMAEIIDRFTETIGLRRFAIYVFDYGAPTGFRIAARHPDRIAAIISQNGNAYEEGLSDGWNSDPRLLARPLVRQSKRAARLPQAGDDGLAIYAWRARSRACFAGRIFARQFLSRPSRRRRGAARSVRRLQVQRRALPGLSELFPRPQAAPAGRVGQERSLLSPAGRRGVQARHSRRDRPVFRHRPFRA